MAEEKTATPPTITIYTDGSSRGNPGPGGYGIVLMSGPHYKEASCGYRRTTNNRMELLGVIKALEMLKIPHSEVTIYTDSKYVANAINKKWLDNWIEMGLSYMKNPDLWSRYIKIAKQHCVKIIWVKGHADNPYNNRCDKLAVAAATSNDLHIDAYFENTENGGKLPL